MLKCATFGALNSVVGDHGLRIHPVRALLPRSCGRLVVHRVASGNCHVILVDRGPVVRTIDVVVVALAVRAHFRFRVFVTAAARSWALPLLHGAGLVDERGILPAFVGVHWPALLQATVDDGASFGVHLVDIGG